MPKLMKQIDKNMGSAIFFSSFLTYSIKIAQYTGNKKDKTPFIKVTA
jgi:hypothetical protein